MNGWPAEKVGKCVHGGRKKEATFPAQALSCSGSTGIISAKWSPRIWRGNASAPRELLKTGFPPAIQRYVSGNFFLRLNKIMQHLPDSVVFYPPFIIKHLS